MVIDSHQHFWKYDPVRDSWIDDSMKVIQKDFLPEDLKPILQRNGVDGCIAVQADQSEAETEFLLQCARRNSFVKGVIGWVDLMDEKIADRLTYFSKNDLLKGVRHIIQSEKDDFVLRKDFQNGISKLEKFKLTFDLLIYSSQLPAVLKLVEKFPGQKFILNHLAKPTISETMDAEWRKNIQLLGTNANVCCKLSGLVTQTEGSQWDEHDFIPFLDTIVEAFGEDRILYGSDWPVCLLKGKYEEVIRIIKNYFQNYSFEAKTKIFGGNAAAVYNI